MFSEKYFRRNLNKLSIFALFLSAISLQWGCASKKITDNIEIWEGPPLNYGRMSASLGMTLLDDGRLIIVGGSPTESPFIPLQGKKAIEVAEKSCILSEKCRQQGINCRCWQPFDLDVPYPLAGKLYRLPDGRLISFSSIFAFDPYSKRLDPKPPDKETPSSGAVAAVIIDLNRKKITPIYRPVDNIPGNPPLKKGESISLLQRAFERSIQLRDGRIVRIGGYVLYKEPPPDIRCIDSVCNYCPRGKNCTPGTPKVACSPDTAEKDCSKMPGKSEKFIMPYIEIYTPPTRKFPLGSVKVVKMPEGRSSVGAIQLKDGRILITGGWGPLGTGTNQVYKKSYLLDPDLPPSEALKTGPNSLFYREDHAMTMLRDGRILITGGTDENGITVNTAEIFDPRKGIFLYAPSMTLAREDHVPMPLGPWWVFIGGEDNGKADLIRNTVEIYNALTAEYIGPLFLFSKPNSGRDKGMAGITDFASVSLDSNTILITGGQQGLQDRDGEYISAGRGSRRTLILRYTKK